MPAGTGDHSVQPGCVGTALAHWHRGTSTGTLTQCTGAAGGAARGVAPAAQRGGQRPWPHRSTKTAPSPELCGHTPCVQPRGGLPGLCSPAGLVAPSTGLCAGAARQAAPRAAPPAAPVRCVSVPVLVQRCQWATAVVSHPGCTLWSPVPAGMAQRWLLSVGTALEQLVQNPYQSARLAHPRCTGSGGLP